MHFATPSAPPNAVLCLDFITQSCMHFATPSAPPNAVLCLDFIQGAGVAEPVERVPPVQFCSVGEVLLRPEPVAVDPADRIDLRIVPNVLPVGHFRPSQEQCQITGSKIKKLNGSAVVRIRDGWALDGHAVHWVRNWHGFGGRWCGSKPCVGQRTWQNQRSHKTWIAIAGWTTWRPTPTAALVKESASQFVSLRSPGSASKSSKHAHGTVQHTRHEE